MKRLTTAALLVCLSAWAGACLRLPAQPVEPECWSRTHRDGSVIWHVGDVRCEWHPAKPIRIDCTTYCKRVSTP